MSIIQAREVVYVPLIQAQPAFATVEAIPVPAKWNSAIPPDVWGIFQSAESLTIRQHIKLLPKQCCACPPCVKQENSYSIFAGLTKDAEAEFLRVDEVSDDWNRCCCAPYHPLRLEVRSYVPLPGDGTRSDFSHLTDDFKNDLGRFTGRDQANLITNFYRSMPPMVSMVRDDGQRCCCKCPCKWLTTFVCFKCCQDGMHTFVGPVTDEEKKEKGRPFNLDPTKLVASAIQPVFGGWCFPTIELRAEDESDTSNPFAIVQGPCCFGGWSEMCCDFKFDVTSFNGTVKGDMATIVKKKPSSLTQGAVMLFDNGGADVFTIEFNKGANLNAAQKISVLTAQMLADYMLFDGNTKKCDQDDNYIYCYCFYCSIIGYLCPCYIAIPKNMGSQ